MKHIVYDKDKPNEIVLEVEAETQEEAISKAYKEIGNRALVLTYKQGGTKMSELIRQCNDCGYTSGSQNFGHIVEDGEIINQCPECYSENVIEQLNQQEEN